MKKTKAIETMQDLPADFDLDVLIEKLIFIDKIEQGLEQLNAKKTYTHEQVKQRVGEWQK